MEIYVINYITLVKFPLAYISAFIVYECQSIQNSCDKCISVTHCIRLFSPFILIKFFFVCVCMDKKYFVENPDSNNVTKAIME